MMKSLHDRAYDLADQCEQLAAQPKAYDSMKYAIAKVLAETYCAALIEYSWWDGNQDVCGSEDNHITLVTAKERAYNDACVKS
jgi:hypothetical protein